MNITMSNAVFLDQRNNQHSFESYFVPARTIRYIHIPESVRKLRFNTECSSANKYRTFVHTFVKIGPDM